MYIIGITGAIGHGKTTLADAFLRQINSARHTESSRLVGLVADELNKSYLPTRPTADNISAVNAWLSNLPKYLQEVAHHPELVKPVHIPAGHNMRTDPDFEKLADYLDKVAANHSLVTQKVTEENKETYRTLMQWIGGFVTKHINPTLWYDELIRQAKLVEDTDCQLYVIGGVRFPSDAQVIHSAGGKIVAIERPNVKKLDQTDPTEAFRSMVPADTTVINDGDVGALDHVVYALWKDLQNDDLQPRYQASRINFGADSSPSVQQREIL